MLAPMKRFCIYLTALILPIAILLGIGEYMVRQVPNSYSHKEKCIRKYHDQLETLVLGNSHSFYGIKPQLLDGSAFNLANVSQTFPYDRFLLEKYPYPKLHTVVLTVSYPSFFEQRLEEGRFWYLCSYYKIYMDCPDHSDFSYYNFEASNMDNYRKKLELYLKHSSRIDCDAYGWGTTYKLSRKDMKAWNDGSGAVEAVGRHTYTWDEAVENARINFPAVKGIADFCNGKNIRLFLVTTPCTPEYNALVDQRQLKEMYVLVDSLRKTNEFVHLDYMQDKRFAGDDFFDSDHLSVVGAEKFSKILNNDIHSIKQGETGIPYAK